MITIVSVSCRCSCRIGAADPFPAARAPDPLRSPLAYSGSGFFLKSRIPQTSADDVIGSLHLDLMRRYSPSGGLGSVCKHVLMIGSSAILAVAAPARVS
jgi:hypothetical protein